MVLLELRLTIVSNVVSKVLETLGSGLWCAAWLHEVRQQVHSLFNQSRALPSSLFQDSAGLKVSTVEGWKGDREEIEMGVGVEEGEKLKDGDNQNEERKREGVGVRGRVRERRREEELSRLRSVNTDCVLLMPCS